MIFSLVIIVFFYEDMDKDVIFIFNDRKIEGFIVLCKDFIIVFKY